ncbi:MAG TPA: carbohydrate kinase family protein, partial [Thermoanaerobaculia bacterium]|nr:carbohydrate kinase family protein [Thermoanaerobaculia bacterium]
RAGLLAARLRGLSWDLAGKVGSIAAVYGLESPGPQPPRYRLEEFLERFRGDFGADEAASVSERLRAPD